MKTILALMFVVATSAVACGQCSTGVCSVDVNVRHTEMHRPAAAVLHSILETRPVRTVAVASVHVATHHVARPALRVSHRVLHSLRHMRRCR